MPATVTLDAGATATIECIPDGWCITDDGPGLDLDDVPRLFSVNRTLLSSKQLRLPTRGMVRNGLRVVMGAVAAFGGSLIVETRGRRLALDVYVETGLTIINLQQQVSNALEDNPEQSWDDLAVADIVGDVP